MGGAHTQEGNQIWLEQGKIKTKQIKLERKKTKKENREKIIQ